ncbi:MAG: energy-coupling factor transporter transmembrane component T family protein [Leucobacter sp.]
MTLFDPYAERPDYGPIRFLHRLNPIAKLFGPLPAMVFLVFTRDVTTPLVFLLVAILLLLIGARLSWRVITAILLGTPLVVLLLSLSFGLWTDTSRIDTSVVLFSLGDYSLFLESWEAGLATALRLTSLLSLSLLAGLTTSGPDLVRSMVQQLRVPYRIGYTALAAFRFVPRFGHELAVIRSAHRVRGMAGGRGPLAGVKRWLGYVVPLLAGAIRHAERVALAMDSRAFGATKRRTERHIVPFRARDAAFIALFWVVTGTLAFAIPRTGLTLQ